MSFFRCLSGLRNEKLCIRNLILKETALTNCHLTPEIKLYLITPKCPLWTAKLENCPFNDPFWAFYWPGGQAITRFVLDNTTCFKDSSVLDIGSGSGASAIAAAKAGVKRVVANDIDHVSCEAIQMNAMVNNVDVEVSQENMVQTLIPQYEFDYVFIGDMFYDPAFSLDLITWLSELVKRGTNVLIGDPGRYSLSLIRKKYSLLQIAEYNLLYDTILENNGYKTSSVWTLKP